jgi:hypothetical protein
MPTQKVNSWLGWRNFTVNTWSRHRGARRPRHHARPSLPPPPQPRGGRGDLAAGSTRAAAALSWGPSRVTIELPFDVMARLVRLPRHHHSRPWGSPLAHVADITAHTRGGGPRTSAASTSARVDVCGGGSLDGDKARANKVRPFSLAGSSIFNRLSHRHFWWHETK